MRPALQRLHRDERGQIVPLFILGVVSLVMLIVMLLNTGQEIVNRTEVQNAADAAAITQASWTARSLNVMAMNNVALTQAFAIAAASAAVNTILGEIAVYTVDLGIRYTQGIAANCTGNPFTAVQCGWFLFCAGHLAVKVIEPSYQIGKDNESLTEVMWGKRGVAGRFSTLAIGFSRMNDHIASSFPEFTHDIQRRIADENGVDPPLFYPPARSRGSNLSSTPLPVEDTGSLEDIFPLLTLKLPPKWRLCSAGEYGTHGLPLGIIEYFENFLEHGYPRDKGPYTIARDDADRRISEPLKALSGAPHFKLRNQRKGNNDYTRLLKGAWPLLCMSRRPPLPEEAVVPAPFGQQLSLYKVTVRPDFPNPMERSQEIRDGLSVLAFTRRRARAAVVPGRFANPPSATYAYAQAEVYTEQAAHDLFTQDWRARLVPAKLLERRKNEVVRAVEEFSTLHELFGSLSPDELRRVNAH